MPGQGSSHIARNTKITKTPGKRKKLKKHHKGLVLICSLRLSNTVKLDKKRKKFIPIAIPYGRFLKSVLAVPITSADCNMNMLIKLKILAVIKQKEIILKYFTIWA